MKYPKLVTIAIIEIGKKVLLIKRGNEPELGKWAFPGGDGAFEYTSDPKKAVEIEVDYDLNVLFIPDKLLNIYYREDDTPALAMTYISKIKGEIKINKASVMEYKLVSKDELKKIDLAFDQNKMTADYLKIKN